MPKFLKILLGSCLGTILGLGLLFFIGFLIIVGAASSGDEKPSVAANSILELDMGTIPELTNNVQPSGGFSFELEMDDVLGIHDVIRAIKKAKTDDNIKGIYLNSMAAPGGISKLRLLRSALVDFREDGKFVTSYASNYDQTAYFLATAGDEIYMGPQGILDMRGLGAERMFYKGAMDKMGVKMDIFWAGDFKSATEPYRRTNMSEQSKLQTRQYLSAMWKYMSEDIATARGITPEQVTAYANNMSGWDEGRAKELGLVDGVWRQTEMEAHLRELVGFEEGDKLEKIGVAEYFSARLNKLKGRGDEVAVLFAEGGIINGEGVEGNIGDNKYVDELERLANDDDVKAVVLRVNSGGGSASASENIWYAAEQLKAAGKPFVVSMGAVAASGGYYIAAGADSIYAEPTTITGSIGVFMMFPILKELTEDKMGLTTDTVNITRNANAFSPFRGLGEEEKALLKRRSEAIYDIFLERVSEGRGIPLEDVKKLAGGRVYAGDRALEIGLVDRLAGLDEAIAGAAALADLTEDEYSVGEYPRIGSQLERLLKQLLGEDAVGNLAESTIREQLGNENYQHLQVLKAATEMREPQARLTETVKF
jgi:protease-4